MRHNFGESATSAPASQSSLTVNTERATVMVWKMQRYPSIRPHEGRREGRDGAARLIYNSDASAVNSAFNVQPSLPSSPGRPHPQDTCESASKTLRQY